MSISRSRAVAPQGRLARSFKCALGLVLLSASAFGVRAEPPIVGTWTVAPVAGGCGQVQTYGADGQFRFENAGKVQTGTYTFDVDPSSAGRHELRAQVQSDNGAPDCAGNVYDDTGKSYTGYVEFVTEGNAMVYLDAQDGNAFLELRRQ